MKAVGTKQQNKKKTVRKHTSFFSHSAVSRLVKPCILRMYLTCVGIGLGMVLMPEATGAQSLGESLLERKVCLGCHQVEAARVGPPFSAIAQRYQDKPDAQAYLETSIRQGGSGRWGKLSMPAQPQVNPEEAREMVRWIRSLPASKKKR